MRVPPANFPALLSWFILGPVLGSVPATSAEPAAAHSTGAGKISNAPPVMRLNPGSTGGDWPFKQISALLKAKGWRAYRPIPNGIGERGPTATADIGLGTHIQDTVNVLLFE